MITFTSTEDKADAETTFAALNAAKAICKAMEITLEIVDPPVVVSTPEGAKVLAWLPIAKEDL